MEQPSSPGTNPVDLKNCIEELVKFTLESHVNGTLGWDIGLSKEFCLSLINHQSSKPIFPNAYSPGVPQSPLYIQLALTLYEIITSGSLQAQGASECNKFKQGEKWFDLILEWGSELTDILKSINFQLHVQEPYFTQLKDGLKTVEGRCAVGDYNRIGSGALILFNKCLVLEVQDIHHYGSFFEMLETESLAKALPGVKTIDEGVQVYRKFYSEEKEMSNGVLAICVVKVAAQPYLSLGRILSGLGDEGIRSLLGQERLAGSVP